MDQDNYEKGQPCRFTLLKRSTLSELKRGFYYKTRWGMYGQAGIWSAAIAMKYLWERFDIHMSGADVIFLTAISSWPLMGPREIARRTTWPIPSLSWWGAKMSRSLGNAVTLEDLGAQGYRGREIRFFLLGTHYRKPLHFSYGALETAKNTIRKLDGFIQRLIRFTPGNGYPDTDQWIYNLKKEFTAAMDDDFNVSGALASLFGFINRVGLPLSQGQFDEPERNRILDTIKSLDSILGT